MIVLSKTLWVLTLNFNFGFHLKMLVNISDWGKAYWWLLFKFYTLKLIDWFLVQVINKFIDYLSPSIILSFLFGTKCVCWFGDFGVFIYFLTYFFFYNVWRNWERSTSFLIIAFERGKELQRFLLQHLHFFKQ